MQIENVFFFFSFIHCAIVGLSVASSFSSSFTLFFLLTYIEVVDNDHFNNIPFFELILLFGFLSHYNLQLSLQFEAYQRLLPNARLHTKIFYKENMIGNKFLID